MTSPQDSMTQAHYIVVGGGTSGLVVANRLTENPDVHILVLEAGVNHNDDPRVQVPAFWTTLLGSEADWQYRYVPKPGLGGRTISEPQGKLLRGSSAINCQSFIAPAQAEIDSWAKLGNNNWDWTALSPYYKKFYTLFATTRQRNSRTSSLRMTDPFSGNSTGGYSNAATVDIATKTRSYAGSAYGVPALQRPNFHLITGATVHKIFFEDTSGGVIATGVLATVNGEIKQFTATMEVILAAGVFNTPKLLEKSGIGVFHPFSRGSTHISSSNIDDAPDIDPRFLSHPADLEIFARHIQTLETLRQTRWEAKSPRFLPYP
ncbi:hypothetical protein BOTCAL_0092g00270 [Botryotinia calthae]|uniref:Glucose-methanol-choline oxidoreductase N-terminal domain-containing protein n=1 Tax=Botryotinia calthae TaxID=38488 RepID=A0A4Y8D746_9HELO|nr:hypothetical protein BOTCAL_0092g00270 [Botryotinia calthae]